MTVALIIENIIKSVLILILLTVGFACVTYYERKHCRYAVIRTQSCWSGDSCNPWLML
jgi:NADH:ubiquinone oxidoreductase subunit H